MVNDGGGGDRGEMETHDGRARVARTHCAEALPLANDEPKKRIQVEQVKPQNKTNSGSGHVHSATDRM